MATNAQVEAFVRDVLGCTCPDEVFESIVAVHRPARAGLPAFRALTIGGRLLVYVWREPNAAALDAQLEALVTRGRRERNERDLNRLRVVLASDDPELEARARELFGRFRVDEKVHLHVVPLESVPTA